MSAQPIRHEVVVRAAAAQAFEAYASGIGRWWPAAYTADPATFTDVRIEPHVGGAVVESHRTGAQHPWGEVTVWEPGMRLAYSSTLAQRRDSPSMITVTFEDVAEGCRVVFEHGGWDERNEDQRTKFGDWPAILAGYVAYAEREPDPRPGESDPQ
jgi:hypothetical protein